MFSDGKISPPVGSLLPLQATSGTFLLENLVNLYYAAGVQMLPGLLVKRFQDKMTENRPPPCTGTNTGNMDRAQQPTTLQQFFRSDYF